MVERGRELQSALESCIGSNEHFLARIASLEAVLDVDEEVVDITREVIGVEQNKWQALLKKIKEHIQVFGAGAATGSILTIIVAVLPLVLL